MASIEQTRRAAMGGTINFFGAIGAALRGVGTIRASIWADAPAMPKGELSEVFARAIHENSNSAMDWLYYAAQLHDAERAHCIERAINLAYGDEIVMAEIRRLRRA